MCYPQLLFVQAPWRPVLFINNPKSSTPHLPSLLMMQSHLSSLHITIPLPPTPFPLFFGPTPSNSLPMVNSSITTPIFTTLPQQQDHLLSALMLMSTETYNKAMLSNVDATNNVYSLVSGTFWMLGLFASSTLLWSLFSQVCHLSKEEWSQTMTSKLCKQWKKNQANKPTGTLKCMTLLSHLCSDLEGLGFPSQGVAEIFTIVMTDSTSATASS